MKAHYDGNQRMFNVPLFVCQHMWVPVHKFGYDSFLMYNARMLDAELVQCTDLMWDYSAASS